MENKTIFKGKIFTLEEKDVTIHNKKYKRDVIRHPGGVGILLIQDHKVLLVKQMRHAIDKETLEIPAGKLEYGEDPMQAGLRELNEEAGYECKSLKPIVSFVSTPGFCDEVIWLYQADQPYPAQHKLAMDEDEDITKVWIDLDQAYKMIKNNEIIDAKTIIAIQYALLERSYKS